MLRAVKESLFPSLDYLVSAVQDTPRSGAPELQWEEQEQEEVVERGGAEERRERTRESQPHDTTKDTDILGYFRGDAAALLHSNSFVKCHMQTILINYSTKTA